MISDTVHDHFGSDGKSNQLLILVRRIVDTVPIPIPIILYILPQEFLGMGFVMFNIVLNFVTFYLR